MTDAAAPDDELETAPDHELEEPADPTVDQQAALQEAVDAEQAEGSSAAGA